MNHPTTSPALEVAHGDNEIESFDGWAPVLDAVFTCWTIAAAPVPS